MAVGGLGAMSDRVLLRTCYSDGMSWVERVGMLRIAERSELDSLNDDG